MIAADRRALAALAAVGLLALVFSLGEGGKRSVARQEGADQRPGDTAPLVSSRPSISPSPFATKATPQAPRFPFEYFGRLGEQGETKVLLHGAGRVLAVSGPGPLIQDWEAEELREHMLVVRHVPSGTRYLVELATRRYDLTPQSPDETQQD